MIENYQRLASVPSQRNALDILIAGIARVMPGTFMPDQITHDGKVLTVLW